MSSGEWVWSYRGNVVINWAGGPGVPTLGGVGGGRVEGGREAPPGQFSVMCGEEG